MAHLSLVTQVSTFLSLEGLEGVGSYIPEAKKRHEQTDWHTAPAVVSTSPHHPLQPASILYA
jgi:hypothetical protein